MLIPGTKTLGHRNSKTIADPHTETNDHKINRPGSSNRCQGADTQKLSDNDRVHHIVKLLKQHTKQKRNAETENQLHRRTRC